MSQRRWFTPSGITARILEAAARRAPDPHNIFLAGCYGVVEIFGVNKVLLPMINALFQESLRKVRERKAPNKK